MSANKNWARWSFASVSKHFDNNRQGLKLFIEGTHRDTRTDKDYLEFRMDGPTLREVSKGCWKLRIEVNILVTTTFDEEDFHRIHRNAGIVQEAFVTIPVFRFGNGVDDDNSFLGCYKLLQSKANADLLELNHFGRIDQSVPLMQATVEGHYEMELDLT